jgi:lipopolysaccharide/colanic/teichoic acid biosynthesis glycosyltransferase
MSIVGPRPERPMFVEKFTKEIPDYRKRLAVKPGITGMAQVWHRYDETLSDVKKKRMGCLVLGIKNSLLSDQHIFKSCLTV